MGGMPIGLAAGMQQGGVAGAASAVVAGTSRAQVCMSCYRECPVNCFVGLCGMDYPLGVYRFQSSALCYSCDEASTASVRGADAFEPCSVQEAKAPAPSTEMAGAMTAEAQEAEMHQMATVIRMADAKSGQDAALMALKEATDQYNAQLEVARKEELKADEAKNVVMRAEATLAAAEKKLAETAQEQSSAASASTAAALGGMSGGSGSVGGAGSAAGAAGGAFPGAAGGGGAGGGAGGDPAAYRRQLKAENRMAIESKYRSAMGLEPCSSQVPGVSLASAKAPRLRQSVEVPAPIAERQSLQPEVYPAVPLPAADLPDPSLATALTSLGVAKDLEPPPLAAGEAAAEAPWPAEAEGASFAGGFPLPMGGEIPLPLSALQRPGGLAIVAGAHSLRRRR